MKKRIVYFLLLFFYLTNYQVKGQKKDSILINPLYAQAYREISDMLDGKAPLSIKRAVFLAEWAYLEGRIDYHNYCQSIDSATTFINKFIKANGLDKYKTGKNMALTEYFFNPYSGNGYKPFIYNFNENNQPNEFTRTFVTEVIRTHTGQCRSLPMYYRVLAEEIEAEAYIAFAPRHVFIRYRNEDNHYPEPWVNVELTAHQIIPEFWIKENFQINDTTIKYKVYLHPLSAKETVAYQLSELAFGYWSKFHIYDDFTDICTTKSLQYYPSNPKALIIKGNSIETFLNKHLQKNGYRVDEYTMFYDRKLYEIAQQLKTIGWEQMSDELHEQLEEGNRQAKKIESEKRQQK